MSIITSITPEHRKLYDEYCDACTVEDDAYIRMYHFEPFDKKGEKKLRSFVKAYHIAFRKSNKLQADLEKKFGDNWEIVDKLTTQ
jgi:hypothetical protein